MGILNNSNAISTGGGYTIDNSLRFRSSASAYLSRTPATAGNRKTWTWSAWVKLGTLTGTRTLFGASTSGYTNGYFNLFVNGNNVVEYDVTTLSDSSDRVIRSTTAVFRDPSAWYHIVLKYDVTQATDTNRVLLYVNGESVIFTTAGAGTYPALNTDGPVNSTIQHQLGFRNVDNDRYYDGYLTEVNFVDGQALDPTYFGETDEDTGAWIPKAYEGTYGTNGFYLKGRGTDNSGNGNNWTENNFNTTTSTATTYDIMSDVPTLTDEDTSNFCTLNPLDFQRAGCTYSEGNLKAAWSGDTGLNTGTINIPETGKWYWEVVMPTGQSYQYFAFGIVGDKENVNTNVYLGSVTTGYGIYAVNGTKLVAGVASTYMAAVAQGTVMTIAYDADSGSLYIGAGGSWANGSGATNQAFGTATAVVTGLTGDLTPAFSFNTGNYVVNFGQKPFTYTPPTGYKKLNTFNLPDSTIEDGSEHFGVGLWTGNGSASGPSVTNLNFKPELLWSKSRSTVANNYLYDIVRSPGDSPNKFLGSNTTDAEQTFNAFTLTDTGFNLATTNVYFNQASATYVAWNWKAGGSAVSNTDGTITSTVSANTTAGFSIATWSSPVSNGSTIGHGLSSTPELLILKSRASTSAWGIFAPTILGNKYLYFTSSAGNTNSSYTPGLSNTLMTVPYYTYYFGGPANSGTNLCYAFHSVEGYSKIGSYIGNGNANGQFVYTGFKPKMVIIKSYTGAFAWTILDTERNPENLVHDVLYPSLANAEADATTYASFDAVANGFKLRNAHQYTNYNNYNYLYMAFAENPFKNSTAR